MTARRTRIATAATAAAFGVAGLGLLASPASASTPTATVPTGATSAAPSRAAAACDRAPWESRVEGAPRTFGAGSAGGDYLWHTTDGFRLRVTHATHDTRVYSGVITSNAAMRIDPVKLEKGDTVRLTANRKSLIFVFANHGAIDGVNFHTDCGTSLRVSDLHVGNSTLPAKQVDLGYYRQHPATVPFTVHRYSKPAASTA